MNKAFFIVYAPCSLHFAKWKKNIVLATFNVLNIEWILQSILFLQAFRGDFSA